MFIDKYIKVMERYVELLSKEDKERLNKVRMRFQWADNDKNNAKQSYEQAKNRVSEYKKEIESGENLWLFTPEEQKEYLSSLEEEVKKQEMKIKKAEEDFDKWQKRLEEICPFEDDIIELFHDDIGCIPF